MKRRSFLRSLAAAVPVASFMPYFHTLAAADYRKVRITDVKCMILTSQRYRPMVRIETDAGVYGIGECHHDQNGQGAKDVILNTLKPILVGQDPLDIERLTFRMMRSTSYFGGNHGIATHAVTGTEIALWDCVGKILGVPVRKILGGGCFTDTVRAYRTGSPGNDTSEGITMYKLDISSDWRNRENLAYSYSALKSSVARFEKIRQTVGDDYELAVHCHWELRLPDAITLVNAVAPMRPAWVEDPLPIGFNESWVRLAEVSPVPILCGENLYTCDDFRPFIINQGVHMICIDMTMAGGLLEAKKIGDLAAMYYMPVTAHNVAGPVATIATAQCASTMREFYAHETFPFNSRSVAGDPNIVIYDRDIIKDGHIQLNDQPGLGIDLNPDVAKKYLADGETWWA